MPLQVTEDLKRGRAAILLQVQRPRNKAARTKLDWVVRAKAKRQEDGAGLRTRQRTWKKETAVRDARDLNVAGKKSCGQRKKTP